MPRRPSSQSGFSLAELMVAMAIMMVISGAAVAALLKMTAAQATIWNRTQMHSGIRGATEVLQQEVGQAGRIALPGTNTPTLGQDVTLAAGVQAVTVSDTSGMFIGQKLTIDAGDKQEIVSLTAVSSTQISGVFTKNHLNGAKLQVFGAFATGVIPPLVSNHDTAVSSYAGPADFTFAYGSSDTILKLYGDINSDGKMKYIEYECRIPLGGVGKLYRNVMDWNLTGGSPTATESQILLANITENPGGTPCFKYQTAAVNGVYYVIDVAITLTVQTQLKDPVTKLYDKETKALLNVAPRNVFHAWQLASLGINDRVQPMPNEILALIQ